MTEEKTAKWPRTSRRQERIEQVLEWRQPSITVVLEDVHDRHNIGAVLRSCDAIGVLDVHLIFDIEEPPKKGIARTSSASARKWLRMHRWDNVDACFEHIRAEGKRIVVAGLADDSTRMQEIDFTAPIAVVFGNEHRGASDRAIAMADGTFYIPMMGMIESLNISVACAVTMYEAQRQLEAADRYDAPQLSEHQRAKLRDEWLKK